MSLLYNAIRSAFSRRGPCGAGAPAAARAADEVPGSGYAELAQSILELRRIALLHTQIAGVALLGRILADSRYDDPLRLERHGRSVYSQNDEDGILAEIFRRIGTGSRRFLEFGVERGLECNTLCLLEQGWSGAWIEAHAPYVAEMEAGFRRWVQSGRLTVRTAFVLRENIDALIAGLGLPRDVDLLSIDIDGNDYHVWEAITCIEPRVVVIEYNAKFPPPMEWIMTYDASHRWRGDDQFGASLESMTRLGRSKGYDLVGCNITGANAFFVRSELAAGKFALPAAAATFYQPARYYLLPSFTSGHPPGFSRSQNP